MKTSVANNRVVRAGRPLGDVSGRLRIDVTVEHEDLAGVLAKNLTDNVRAGGFHGDGADRRVPEPGHLASRQLGDLAFVSGRVRTGGCYKIPRKVDQLALTRGESVEHVSLAGRLRALRRRRAPPHSWHRRYPQPNIGGPSLRPATSRTCLA